MKRETRVLIIGGGATGTGLARDLALRGVECLLVEKRDLAVGASGGNHGLLHSGARYVGSDPHAAVECRDEGALLKRLAPHLVDDCGGFFVAVPGDDERYIADFPALCAASGISTRAVDPHEARALEPALSPDVVAAYAVPDAAVDPFMLCLDNMAQAEALGASALRDTRVDGVRCEGGRIVSVQCVDDTTGERLEIEPEIVVNASGAWAGLVAGLAGVDLTVLFSKGTLVVTQDRIARRVVNRLRRASDADILVPGGTVSILGTTSERIDHPDHARPTVAEVDRMIDDGAKMVPELESTRYIRAYAGVRPLVSHGEGGGDDRKVSRGFSLLDHAADGVDNFVTITGGKLTTFRLMAEKTADLVCRKIGVRAPCRTREEPLPPSACGRWTEPGRAARGWVDKLHAEDMILCECEMVSARVVDDIINHIGDKRGRSVLRAVGQRSRVGKGPCQGGFCGPRITSYLYDTGAETGERGLLELKQFIERRWRGKIPVLWGNPLMQAELQEAVHCNIMDLELVDGPDRLEPGEE